MTTGVGDAFGVFVGQTALVATLRRVNPGTFGGWGSAVVSAGVVAAGSFCSGTAWQPATDMAVAQITDFTPAALAVGTICALFFFFGITAAGAGVVAASLQPPSPSRRRAVLQDVTLAVAVGGGAAFFVGTDSRYPGNWLMKVVGERDGAIFFDSVKAGISTALGYAVFQLVLVFVVPQGFLWTDEIKAEPLADVGRESLLEPLDTEEVSIFGQGISEGHDTGSSTHGESYSAYAQVSGTPQCTQDTTDTSIPYVMYE